MRLDKTKKIYTYWNNLRGNRLAPDRKEIEPSDIREILGDTFILETNTNYKTICFRLAGTRLCNAYGRELKGLGFLALWSEEDNLEVLNSVRKVQNAFTPCTISCLAETSSNRSVEYEMILLPLQNQDVSAKRVLGVAAPLESETWIGSDPIINNRVKKIRFLDVEQAPSTFGHSFADPGTKYWTPPESGPKQVGHLTVFDGGLAD